MLNENLARVRKERGLTQEALAVKLNVVRQTISKWEKGTAVPDADTLCKVADELEVPVSELLGNSLQGEKSDKKSPHGDDMESGLHCRARFCRACGGDILLCRQRR